MLRSTATGAEFVSSVIKKLLCNTAYAGTAWKTPLKIKQAVGSALSVDRARLRLILNRLMKNGALIIPLLTISCATTPPPVVIVKHDLAPRPRPIVPNDPYAGLPPDIASAIRAGDTKTVFRHGTTTIYPYSDTMKYVVNCQPNMAVQIRLRDDEDTDENNAVLGDSDRWSIKIGMHTVLLKPLGTNKPIAIQKTLADPQDKATFDIRPPDPDMNSNLIITTNKRRYELVLRLHKPFTDAAAWYYTDDVQQEYAERQTMLKEASQWAATR